MNILIVGNGFDLSHYLPTKYDHFMVAMGAIEGWDEDKGEMGFDDLFGSLYEKENYFFKYTKAMYQTDEIKISIDKVQDLKEELKGNVWYQYFKHHITNIETWIDFEVEIESVLDCVSNFCQEADKIYKLNERLDSQVYHLMQESVAKTNVRCGRNTLQILKCLMIIIDKKDDFLDQNVNVISDQFFRNGNVTLSLDNCYIFMILERFLRKFIDIFNFYLSGVIYNLNLKEKLTNEILEIDDDLRLYSFNYTETFQKIYDNKNIAQYLHGKSGEVHNIVLGISELKSEHLLTSKAYGFTKYHQKLFKNTDYLFLNDDESLKNKIYPRGMGRHDLVKIFIWGHSLSNSDDNYVKEIFSYNEDNYCLVRVIIFYFKEDNFILLNNLLDILGKDKVEKWMKKGWLKFKPNPNIVEINNIQPIDLPKFCEK